MVGVIKNKKIMGKIYIFFAVTGYGQMLIHLIKMQLRNGTLCEEYKPILGNINPHFFH